MNKLIDYIEPYLDKCENQKRLSHDTVKAYTLDLNQFKEYLILLKQKNIKPKDFCKKNIQEYVSHLNERFAVKTVKRKLASLRSFFTYLEEEDVVDINPFFRMHLRIKEPKTLPKAMNINDIERILNAVYTTKIELSYDTIEKGRGNLAEFIHYRDIMVLELLFASGLRVKELCNIKKSDIDFFNIYD